MLRGSQKRQDRVLATIGASVVLTAALVTTLVVVRPFSGRAADQFAVGIETPFVGQGVEEGTPVVLHGVKVGRVTAVTNNADGGVQLQTELQAGPTKGLTDAMNIDFRPINYFGVPGINLVPNAGGQALQDGTDLSLVPTGNFTLSELLKQLGDVSQSSLTPELITVIDRATRYTDGLNPFIETAVTVTRAVDAVQTVPTEQLLTNLSTSIAAFPAFTDAAVEAGTRSIKYDYYPGQVRDPAAASVAKLQFPYLVDAEVPDIAAYTPEQFQNTVIATMDVIEKGLFGSVGKLLSSHVDDLVPLISGFQAVTDMGPVMLRPADIAQKLAELRNRFFTLYNGDGTQRAVNVRLLLDSLPGVAAPMGIVAEGTP
ncbi:mammalian cell entry protein [Mycolicibacterium neoaurum]|uniref:mammalian cell entry protein n=1 Tax=Mycolicibacterium neoaurum TaxID=1795 RepID=UPI002672FF17|nr:mammalian cell entry protein [Mycolicibacterium neoaurum]MDO3402706.1 mammalian cell entry protein [Mycolicibacterium neoaurum]